MIDIEKLVRPNILKLKPYASARDEYTGKEGVFLDANENPFGELNRYPDPYQRVLKERLASVKKVDVDHIFVGNGSDEVIDLAFRIFCTPGKNQALSFTPSYGMYDVSAAINNVELVKQPLSSDFQINLRELDFKVMNNRIKLVLICSPNNPTGNLIDRSAIEFILSKFNGMVLVDEAYIDFADEDSMISLTKQFNNLIISQTMSKAWGLAAARIGIAYANEEVIQLFNKVKPPYNVSRINQEAALDALNDRTGFDNKLKLILKERKKLVEQLSEITLVKRIYPSHSNFLLVEVSDADALYNNLIDHKIITRNRNNLIDNCLRISIGTPEENQKLVKTLKDLA